MSSYSLKKQLLVSHNKVSVLATLLLVVAALVAVPLYFNTQSLIKSELPAVIEIDKLKSSVFQSSFLLDSWLQDENAMTREVKYEVWSSSVETIAAKFEAYEKKYLIENGKLNVFAEIKDNVERLKGARQNFERCPDCFFNRESVEFSSLYEELIFLGQNVDGLLSDLIETRHSKINEVLSIIAGCLILFCVVSVSCAVLFNIYTFLVVRNTAEYYLSRLRKIIGATTFFSESDPEFLKPEGNDEIAQLMREFNAMQEAIFSREAELRLQNDDISQLTRVVTHDMKPPIINIKGHANIIANNGDALLSIGGETESSRENVNAVKKSIAYIEQSVSRLDELVAGILTYSKLSDKEIKLEKVPILDVIKEILDVNHHRLTVARVNVLEYFPEVLFDRFVVKFMVSTLIDNAITYQDESRRLIITIGYCENDDTHEISIKDNGVGMNQHQVNNLFQVSNKASVLGGAGIGLATAKTLIRRLNGDIVYRENDSGVGSLFVIILPR